MNDNGEKQPGSNTVPNNEVLVWAIGGGAIVVALLIFLGQQAMRLIAWLLLFGGIALLINVVRGMARSNSVQWQELKQWVAKFDLRHRWAVLGGLLLLTGLIARFGPRDVSLVLSIFGVILLAGGIWYASRVSEPTTVSLVNEPMPASSNGNKAEQEVNGYTRLSQEFRLRVAETVFRNAKTSSQLNFMIGMIFFLVGIGLFVLLAYGVFQLQGTGVSNNSDDTLTQAVVTQLTYALSNSNDRPMSDVLTQFSPLLLLMLRDISARQLVPIVSLIIIAWIGSRLVFNATRLSQRRIIREALEELGPLQDTLAGIPPRKPFLQVVEQGLRHTRRAFTIRLWLSIALGFVGIALLIVTAVRGLQPNSGDWITTATIGASGVVSFIVSLVTTRQNEIKDNLIQSLQEEARVAQNAQRSEIVDLYVAQLLRSGAKPQNLRGVLAILGNSPDVDGNHQEETKEEQTH